MTKARNEKGDCKYHLEVIVCRFTYLEASVLIALLFSFALALTLA